MTDYTELIKALRSHAESICSLGSGFKSCGAIICSDAADAIEELRLQLKVSEGNADGWRSRAMDYES